jgi:hypothetical protein
MASALLLQLGGSLQPMNEDEPHITALKFYYLKRGHPQAKDQLLTPSQIRFIKFFSDCLSAGIVTPLVSTHVIFASFLFTTLQGISRQAARLCIDSVSLDVPFSCDDLIVRVISDGLTWDSSSSSRISVDSNGSCVCPVNFSVVDDVIVAIYSSTFVKPVASLAFHTLVSYCISLSPCLLFDSGFQFLPPESYTMVLQLDELDLHSFQPDPQAPFQVKSIFVMRYSIHFGAGACGDVAVGCTASRACLCWSIPVRLFRGTHHHHCCHHRQL